MRIDTRLQRLEALTQQALDAEVRHLDQHPRVSAYLDRIALDELRLLARGDLDAIQRFSRACAFEVT